MTRPKTFPLCNVHVLWLLNLKIFETKSSRKKDMPFLGTVNIQESMLHFLYPDLLTIHQHTLAEQSEDSML